jgi:signal peptidase I
MAVATKTKKDESFLDIVKSIAWIVVFVMVIRTFIFEPFNIPSGSMIPTLLVGDYVFVSKFSYGISKYSFPFWNPPFSGRIFGSLPNRGDVAVFRLPRDPSVDYIKRIIGLPGDKIQVTQGQLYINGTAVPREQIADYADDEYGRVEIIRQFIETLPDTGVKHPILQNGDDGLLDNTQEFVVPPDHVFAMGDNRTNSQDSRAMSAVGYVPVENLVGHALFRFYSFDSNTHWYEVWRWPFAIRYSRLFTPIH